MSKDLTCFPLEALEPLKTVLNTPKYLNFIFSKNRVQKSKIPKIEWFLTKSNRRLIEIDDFWLSLIAAALDWILCFFLLMLIIVHIMYKGHYTNNTIMIYKRHQFERYRHASKTLLHDYLIRFDFPWCSINTLFMLLGGFNTHAARSFLWGRSSVLNTHLLGCLLACKEQC